MDEDFSMYILNENITFVLNLGLSSTVFCLCLIILFYLKIDKCSLVLKYNLNFISLFITLVVLCVRTKT